MVIDMRFAAVAIVGIYLGVAALERAPGLQFRKLRFLRPGFLTDVSWYVSAVSITTAFGPFMEGLSRLVEGAGVPTLASASLPLWSLVALAVVLYDFGAFACHVMLHRADRLWRLHKVHHSSPVLDWLATTRSHVAEHLFRGIPIQTALFAIGLPTEAVALGLIIYVAFATLGHSNLRLDLRFLEGVFITPRLHRLHHVPATTDKNFATVFSFWDRMAGSFVAKDTAPDEPLGVPAEVRTYPQSWWQQLCEPFRVSKQETFVSDGRSRA
jgi:lathosterol oxidase